MNGNVLLPYIPETITVHLGPPSVDAANVTVSFTDYIKNVASSEIYPTWPENALRAYQELFDIPNTGVVGSVTWNSITSTYQSL